MLFDTYSLVSSFKGPKFVANIEYETSEYAQLDRIVSEQTRWCDKNLKNHWTYHFTDLNRAKWTFLDPDDALMFKLVWG
jgi:hypothetical protein